MKFMLLMQFPLAELKTSLMQTGSRAEIDAHMAFLRSLNEDLEKSGELVGIQALAGPDAAVLVRAAPDGSPLVTDGPFPESKEFLAGYWIVDVASARRAHEIAARASSAPGHGGKPLNMPIHVQMLTMCASRDG